MTEILQTISWSYIKNRLKTEGAENKLYDEDTNGSIEISKLNLIGIKNRFLKNFTNPEILIATSSMKHLLNSADKHEYAAGNITATTKELTIIGGDSSTATYSWIYFDLYFPAHKAYIKANLNAYNCRFISIDICDDLGSNLSNPPDFYEIRLVPSAQLSDLMLIKTVGGSSDLLATEAVDLLQAHYYLIEIYIEIAETNHLEIYRDKELALAYEESELNISQILSFRIRVYDASTSEAQAGKVCAPVVIIYE